MDRIRVGIVRLSATRGWGATAHLPALRALPDYEVTALSSTSKRAGEAAGAAHGVRLTFHDARELAEHPEVDLVVVAVTVPFHRELVTIAVEAGKPVLCEWPLANGLREAESLADLASEHGVRGFVGLQARSAPPVRFVRDLVTSGEIGEVLSTTPRRVWRPVGATVHPTGVYNARPPRDSASGTTAARRPVQDARECRTSRAQRTVRPPSTTSVSPVT